MGINHIDLVGALVRNPEMRYTPNGIPTTQFSLAVTRPPREGSRGEVTDYVNVITWRKLAETAAESLKKGDLVSVEGRLLTRTYETKEGQRRKVVEVEALSFEAIQGGGRSESETEFGTDSIPGIETEQGEDVDEIPF